MKICKFFIPALAVLALVACDSTYEYHSTSFYPSNESIITYADQDCDTILVVSYDSWTLTNTCDWLTVKVANSQVDDISINVASGYYDVTRLDFYPEPNTTGSTRSTVIKVVSSYSDTGTLGVYFYQYPFLHITNPSPSADSDGNATFTLYVEGDAVSSSDEVDSSISFYVYDEDATLTTSDSWVTPEQTSGFTTGEELTIPLTIEANDTGARRSATLTLTSLGITNTITIVQAVLSDDDDDDDDEEE